jgi:hypothetical protein
MRINSIAGACIVLMVAVAVPLQAERGDRPDSHPLMPGIRSPEIWNKDWPRTHHDKLATGFSPLVCGMQGAPTEWSSIALPGQLDWLKVIESPGRDDTLLVSDDHLKLISFDGKKLWSQAPVGNVIYQGDLHGDGRTCLLMSAGRRLTELDAATGETQWTHEFMPEFVGLVVRVADILTDRPGQEAAVILVHGEEGCLISFPPNSKPEIVWQRTLVKSGEFDERYDHGCSIELDLSNPAEPVIWNFRRYRCCGINPRNGDVISTLAYDIGGEHRRNYGTNALGFDGDGNRLAVVLGESVQIHAHAIRLNRSGQNVLAWQHYYGEVYKDAPGVALEHLAVSDLDGDGATEVVYSVRDPQRGYKSVVRVRDAASGKAKLELPDHWGAAVLSSQPEGAPQLLLAFHAPDGAMPTQGKLIAYATGPSELGKKIGELPDATLLLPEGGLPAKQEFFVRQVDSSGASTICRYRWNDAGIELAQTLADELFRTTKLKAILRGQDGTERLAVQSKGGELVLAELSGREIATVPLRGLATPTVSAADLDGDHHAELLVQLPQGRLQIYSFDEQGQAELRAEYPHVAFCQGMGPVCYDLVGEGRPQIVCVGQAPDGRLTVSAQRLGGSAAWEQKLDLFADEIVGCVINAGNFLASDHAGVAISVDDSKRVHEGTYLLDGKTGAIRWFKSHYRDGAVVMPYRPNGVPTAIDFDGDGTEEIGMDLLSYMAFLRGVDGSFAFVRHTHNIRTENAVYAGHLYNTFLPVFAETQARKPYWFVNGGYGPFGLMKPDPTEGVWNVDLGYDVPPKVGLVDVDGDGKIEAGYAAIFDRKFVCRDLFSGEVEWEVELPGPPNSPIYSADVDGDGKGEFLAGNYCIGTNEQGVGELRWQAPVPIGWCAIADFDGDGQGEIACPTAGRAVILHGDHRVAEQSPAN